MLSHGLLNLSVTELVIYTLVVTHITIVAVTVFLHRHSAHRALELHPLLQHFFRAWLWFTTGMGTRQWTAVHRKHHAKCETEEDPHSPVVKGIGEIFWRGVENYRIEATNEETLAKYGRGCPDDWLERNVYEKYTTGGITALALINISLFGALGLTIWAIQMIWIPLFAAGVINGIGHWWGYRNFECPDAARNISPWGILIGGEELHNNHHTYPNSAKLSAKWYEFDIGWMWIRLFEMLGLARVISTGPVVQRVPNKTVLDKDAAWALLNDRFHVMARYSKEVVKPVMAQEYRKADAASRKLIKRARRVMVRQPLLVNDSGRDRISAVVQTSAEIRVIHELHHRLQEIWAKRGGNMDEVIQALREWCKEAEASGLQSLENFAQTLKSYATPQVATA
ncbi:MAG: transposase [bacterium]